MKKYNSFDLLKVFLAIFVIAIHTDPLPEHKYLFYELLLQSAVPCFLMISAFLLFKKNETNDNTIKKHLFKIIKLYLIWTIIYLPISIYFFANSDSSIKIIIIRFFKDFIFVGQQPYSYQFWYLLSTIYCLLILLFFKKKKINDLYLLCLALFLYVIGMIIDYYTLNINSLNGVMYKIFYIIKHTFGSGRMFYSMIYIFIGMYISKNNIRIKSIYCITSIIFLSILSYYTKIEIFKILLYVSIFMTFVSMNLKNSTKYFFLRKTSTIMYFTHMIFFFIYTLIIGQDKCKGLFGFLFTLFGTILLSIIVFYIGKKHPNNKIIKYIF